MKKREKRKNTHREQTLKRISYISQSHVGGSRNFHKSRETWNAKRRTLVSRADLRRFVFGDAEERKGTTSSRGEAKGELTNGKDLSGATAGVRAFFIGGRGGVARRVK